MYDWHTDAVKTMNKKIKTLTKKIQKGGKSEVEDISSLLRTEKDLELSRSMLSELNGIPGEYHTAYNKIIKPWAKDHSSVRVTLALDDAAKGTKYPWLQDMLTADDKAAIGRLRKQLDQYKVRREARGLKVRKDGYVHYQPNPGYLKQLGKSAQVGTHPDAVAFMKFYERAANSKPLSPDINSTMSRYIRDTEQRFAKRDFWKGIKGEFSGW